MSSYRYLGAGSHPTAAEQQLITRPSGINSSYNFMNAVILILTASAAQQQHYKFLNFPLRTWSEYGKHCCSQNSRPHDKLPLLGEKKLQ